MAVQVRIAGLGPTILPAMGTDLPQRALRIERKHDLHRARTGYGNALIALSLSTRIN
jgi:hypothetical protein